VLPRDGLRAWHGLAAVTLCLVALLGAHPAAAQRGAITAPRNLSEMVDQAGVIVRGQILTAHAEPHPQFPALWTVVVTLQVSESLKGQPGATYTFRQFIWDMRDREDAAGYRKGSHMLLLLLSPNAQGLSSPIGLEQGRFRITSDAGGNLLAVNGRGNAGLLNGVAVSASSKGVALSGRAAAMVAAPAAGPLPLDDLRGLIRQLAGAN